MEKEYDRMEKTGIWTPESGVNYTKSEAVRVEQTAQKLQNKTLRVVTTFVSKTPHSVISVPCKNVLR